MIYYQDNEVLIRNLQEGDAQVITDGEIAQGWNSEGRLDKYLMRLKDQAEGRAIVMAAEYRGEVAGYICVYPDSKQGAFAGLGYPEIVDFGVLEKYQKRGIGSRLMDAAERTAAEYADTVYLGVGLHSGGGQMGRVPDTDEDGSAGMVRQSCGKKGSGAGERRRAADPGIFGAGRLLHGA